ncbi:MAG: chemoreceptor glutamine deamidase CheD [Gammaproteobacteria bacterium]
MSQFKKERNENVPKCIKGFEHINRFWDGMHNVFSAKILPGEFYVSTQGEMISTVLGSCVSACIRDPIMGVGGMNHFMLPATKENIANITNINDAARYGNFAMEEMINVILKAGGKKENLEVKLFGGGKVLPGMNTLDIGAKNISFVRGYVALEDLNVVSSDLGDIYPRKVLFFADSGKVKMKKLKTVHNKTIAAREESYKQKIEQKPVSGDIELF